MQSCMVHKVYRDLSNWTIGIRGILRTTEVRETILKHYMTMSGINVRWAFNAKAWQPKAEEILAASSYIQPEEKIRIGKFVYQDDAKSSLIGRLMLRKYAHLHCSVPYEQAQFGRDERGKPYLTGLGDVPITFNVSHQGDYVVLAGNTKNDIGVDTMKIEPVTNKNVQEFFRLMRRQFSDEEWETIYSYPTEMEQLSSFYRFWCLKESYVKNIGIGITIPLQEISFTIKTRELKVGEFATDTVLYKKGVLMKDWMFEETLLDEKHAAAVSFVIDKDHEHVLVPYTFLSFEELVKEAKPLVEADQAFQEDFMKKELKWN